MGTLYENIDELCSGKRISINKMCTDLGMRNSVISDLKMGRKKGLNAETLNKIASYFGVSVDYLLGNESVSDGPPAPSRPGSKWIPVLGKVAAGTPIEAVEDILDYEEIDAQTAASGEHFALQIKGQSMEPRIKDGDVVIVRRQDDCDSGDIAVVLVNGDEATVKRIKKEPAGIMLIPSNPSYEPKFYSNDEILSLPVRIIGKVIELRAKF